MPAYGSHVANEVKRPMVRMSETALYNIVVLIGIVVGQFVVPGPVGLMLGAGGGTVASALLYERFGPSRRSTDGFWLRHRGEFCESFRAVRSLGGGQILPSWPTVISAILGFVGGFQVGDWVASQVGWAGECHESELEARGAYLCVLASAAWADGVVSTKDAPADLGGRQTRFDGGRLRRGMRRRQSHRSRSRAGR